MDMNLVIISGRVAGDVKTGAGGTWTRASFMVETRSKKDGERQVITTRTPVTLWGKQADDAAVQGRDGAEVTVVGELARRKVEGKDGGATYLTEVKAATVTWGQGGAAPAAPTGDNDLPF